MDFNTEIQNATIKNLAAKSKIMAFIFIGIFILQVISISILLSTTNIIEEGKRFTPMIGMVLIMVAFIVEWSTYKYLKKVFESGRSVNASLPYILTIIEISFPTVILFFAGAMIRYLKIDYVHQLLSSAPAVMYFIMITLSSLMMNRKICFISGLLAGLEYALMTFYLLRNSLNFQIDFVGHASKAIMMVLAGIVAGYVAIKIKESVIDTLKAKDDLISKLDGLVKEKTIEITLQKDELEAKNKDIMDSIHYAKRIQDAQMPSEKFIARVMNKLKKR